MTRSIFTLVTSMNYQCCGVSPVFSQIDCDLAERHDVKVCVDASRAGERSYARYGFANERAPDCGHIASIDQRCQKRRNDTDGACNGYSCFHPVYRYQYLGA